MTATSHSTAPPGAATQEVLLRTLASDIISLQHGNQVPTPEQYTAQFTGSQENAGGKTHNAGGVIKLIFTLLFLAGIGVAIYYFVYPSFVSVSP